VDLAYLRANPQHLPAFLTHQRIRETPVSGGSICVAQRLTLDDGVSVFAKSLPGAALDFFASEAAGLRWLRDADAVPVPEILAALPDLLALEWVEPGPPDPAAAERFGRELAAMHRAGADSFGAAWPGYIGRLRVDNTPSDGPWHEWFVATRLEPFLRQSADRGSLSTADVTLVERAISRIDGYGADEAPSRLHGDLWDGNLVWSRDRRVWLVDPSAHGGHRESDLAFLTLFSPPPHFDRMQAAYHEAWPLADGWQDRVPVHQLYPALVHTAHFSGYRDVVISLAHRLA
jgi:fructosamine-3-kinase